MRLPPLLILVISLAWAALAVLSAGQSALAAALQGKAVEPVLPALRVALIQSLPWIPVSLAGVWAARRMPLTAQQWRQRVLPHVLLMAVMGVLANGLMVLGFWWSSGRFAGFAALVKAALVWGTANLHIALLVYGVFLGATQAVDYYRAARARELHTARVEGQLARAQVEALNAQIRPHFLFNTLHTIGQLWRSGRSDEADTMLDHLGALFHKVQGGAGRTEVVLEEELDIVREYLKIEEARFRDRLTVTIDATPDALRLFVPPLVLQPLVENAVRHGISPISTAGKIVLTARVVEPRTLVVTVQDDGPGFGTGATRPGSGTGIRNTRERIAQLYGVHATLSVENVSTGGTLVTLRLPASVEPMSAEVS